MMLADNALADTRTRRGREQRGTGQRRHDSMRDVTCLIVFRFSSPFRTVVKELLNSISRCPFRSNPRSLLSPSQRGQNHPVEISRAFSFKLCLNVESLICLSNGSLVGDKLFKNRFDG